MYCGTVLGTAVLCCCAVLLCCTAVLFLLLNCCCCCTAVLTDAALRILLLFCVERGDGKRSVDDVCMVGRWQVKLGQVLRGSGFVLGPGLGLLHVLRGTCCTPCCKRGLPIDCWSAHQVRSCVVVALLNSQVAALNSKPLCILTAEVHSDSVHQQSSSTAAVPVVCCSTAALLVQQQQCVQ